jgi:hypothetical protein
MRESLLAHMIIVLIYLYHVYVYLKFYTLVDVNEIVSCPWVAPLG